MFSTKVATNIFPISKICACTVATARAIGGFAKDSGPLIGQVYWMKSSKGIAPDSELRNPRKLLSLSLVNA